MLDIPGAEEKDGEAGPDDGESAVDGWARDEYCCVSGYCTVWFEGFHSRSAGYMECVDARRVVLIGAGDLGI